MDQNGDKVEIKVITGTGLLKHAPFQVGDFLVSVNNQKCTSAEKTIQDLVKMEAGIPITLLVETPHGNPNLVQAMVRKPSSDANLGIGFYVPAEPVEVKKEEEGEGENDPTVASETTQAPVSKESGTKRSDDPTANLLRINNIDANGLLSHSALSQGDLVMAINATPCSQMTADEATALLDQSDDSVTITAMKPPSQTSSRTQRWLRQLKRVGVAIGGGTVSAGPAQFFNDIFAPSHTKSRW
jgi:C-terminal processing protease CtpA/Prc